MKEKNLGLGSVIGTCVGLIVATSCLLSLGQGAGAIGVTIIISMTIACILNMMTGLSIAELNAVMPNLTGGLAQYTLAGLGPFVSLVTMVGGYLVCNTVIGSAECAMFGNTINAAFPSLPISGATYCIGLLIFLVVVNLFGVDMFAKVQNFLAYSLIGSLLIMGILGVVKAGTGTPVIQPAVLSSNFTDITSLCGLAFFLFIGVEYVIPIAHRVKNERRNIPLGMMISLLVILLMQSILVFGFKNYTSWEDLSASTTPHVLYGTLLLGNVGTVWMAIVSILAVCSSINTVIASLAYVCNGMAKIGLLPGIFMKKNRFGAPYIGLLLIGGAMIVINATGLSTSDKLTFLILAGCCFWMITYMIAHVNVLVLRKRMPHVPRTFKVPGGSVLPIIGIVGTAWMVYNIASDPVMRIQIYKLCLAIFVILTVYALIWIKFVMKVPLFKPFSVKDVMAMEHDLYPVYHRNGFRPISSNTGNPIKEK